MILCVSGIKNADEEELAVIASEPKSDFSFFVGDFKILDTLLPLVAPRICTTSGGVYASDGTYSHPSHINKLNGPQHRPKNFL